MAYMNILHYHSVQLPPMNCKIVLDSEKSYSAGDNVSGKFLINCSKEIFSFGIRIALEGTAMVKFKDQGVQSKTDMIAQSHIYVFGKGDVRIRLAPGDHEFPFSLRLFGLDTSPSLPGSFRSPFGLILYQLVGYIQLEWKFVSKAEKTIQVESYMNLGLVEPSVFTPVTLEKSEKSLLPSFISSGSSKFRFTFRMPHSGYLCGDQIAFDLEVENPSNYQVTLKQVTLLQKIIYNAGNAWKTKQKPIVKICNKVEGLWKDGLQIPFGILPTQKCIIEVQYILRIEVKTEGQGSLRGDIRLTIGTTREADRAILLLPNPEVDSIARNRSPSPCPAVGRRRCGATHKSLDRSDSMSSAGSAGSRPPRYSQLSIHRSRSTSTETVPPSYEDSMVEMGKHTKSPDAESLEIQEFKRMTDEEQIDEEEEEDEIEEDETPSPSGEINVITPSIQALDLKEDSEIQLTNN